MPASDHAAPALEGTMWPPLVRRAACTSLAMYRLLGCRKRAVNSRSKAAAAIGSSSKQPRWPVKKMNGPLRSRSSAKISAPSTSMRPASGFSGSKSKRSSRNTNSAASRPIWPQLSRATCSTQAASFSG